MCKESIMRPGTQTVSALGLGYTYKRSHFSHDLFVLLEPSIPLTAGHSINIHTLGWLLPLLKNSFTGFSSFNNTTKAASVHCENEIKVLGAREGSVAR